MTVGKKERLLILGASVRAAAQSAVAAGYEVIAADQFADRDLREICPAARAVKYPEGLLEFAMTVEPCAWMYTGALENYPEIVEEISKRHELLGNGPEVLKRVRNPRELAAFAEEGRPCLFPEICFGKPSAEKRWLVKRVASGGGLGVRFANSDTHLGPGEYFQEWIDGRHGSAMYLASHDETRLLFGSEQIVDAAFLAAPRFHYAGNLGSFPPGLGLHIDGDYFERLGIEVASQFGLRGLFGLDFVSKPGEVWLLEINPRYTASMELWERKVGAGLSSVKEHLVACDQTRWPVESHIDCEDVTVEAKGILYAREDFHITDRMSDRLWGMRDELDLADLPVGGSFIAKGHAVLTMFASGKRRKETLKSLEDKANGLRALGIP